MFAISFALVTLGAAAVPRVPFDRLVQQYLMAENAMDVDGVMRMYDANACVSCPSSSPPQCGTATIKSHIQAIFNEITMLAQRQTSPLYTFNMTAAYIKDVAVQPKATVSSAAFPAAVDMTFNDAGLITNYGCVYTNSTPKIHLEAVFSGLIAAANARDARAFAQIFATNGCFGSIGASEPLACGQTAIASTLADEWSNFTFMAISMDGVVIPGVMDVAFQLATVVVDKNFPGHPLFLDEAVYVKVDETNKITFLGANGVDRHADRVSNGRSSIFHH